MLTNIHQPYREKEIVILENFDLVTTRKFIPYNRKLNSDYRWHKKFKIVSAKKIFC